MQIGADRLRAESMRRLCLELFGPERVRREFGAEEGTEEEDGAGVPGGTDEPDELLVIPLPGADPEVGIEDQDRSLQ
eukprot:1070000-Pyramimonas_sp.AAC.1